MLGAVRQDADQPPRQPREQVGGVERVLDRLRFRLEEQDQVDVGGEIQLSGAELAHAEHDEAGAVAGPVAVGQRELALVVRLAQQEVDRRTHGRVGQRAQEAHARRGIGRPREVGERDQHMRFRLQEAKVGHQRLLGHALDRPGVADLVGDGLDARVPGHVEQRLEDARAAAQRVAHIGRQRDRAGQEGGDLRARRRQVREPGATRLGGGGQDVP